MRILCLLFLFLCFSGFNQTGADDFFDDLVLEEAVIKTEEQPSENIMAVTSREMNVLVTLALLESDPNCEYGPLDVLHVVFNRIKSPLFPGTVEKIAFQSGAFQPFFALNGRANAALRNQTFSSREKAAAFAAKKRKGLTKAAALQKMTEIEEALKDQQKMLDSRDFVGGRSFFLGATQSFRPEFGDVRRKKGSNHFKYGILSADRKLHKPYCEQLIESAPLKVVTK